MTVFPIAAAGLVSREVHSGFRDGAATKIAIARRAYPTDQADLWDAVTNVDRIPRWFLPISGELRAGGRYQLEGNAGGTIERCEEPDSFAVTWEYGSMTSWLEVTPHPGRERHHPGARARGAPRAWSLGAVRSRRSGRRLGLGLVGLGLHLESGAAVDPVEALAFPTSPEGIEFIRQAAAGWADAAVGDGDEPAAAQDAATRTVAFYTTEPEDVSGS